MQSVKELIGAGHKVLGLARSEAGAQALAATGADVQPGVLEDVSSLRNGAAASDAVIHLAFIHDFSKFQENCCRNHRSRLEGSGGFSVAGKGCGTFWMAGHVCWR